MDTPNAMVYSSQSHRGLGVVRASWEAFLQHINISRKLALLDDPYLHECRDVASEESECLLKLGLQSPMTEEPSADPDGLTSPAPRLSVRNLRSSLRNREFSSWCSLQSRGLGVEVFADTPSCNNWVGHRTGLSTSEWTNALKMSSNNCNLRGNPRTSSSTLHCRHCSEMETLAHVLGKCPRGELLRNRRHHQVCDAIAEQLRSQGCTVYREDHQSTEDQGSRFSDLVVLDSQGDIKRGYILDPTIRLERSLSQADDVDVEKRGIYEPTLPNYMARFPEVGQWRVIGLLFGARGAIPHFTTEVLTRTLHLPKRVLLDIGLLILKASLGILHHHIYSRDASA